MPLSHASSLRAALAAFGLATSAACLATSPAAGALLIEGVFAGKALRIVVDKETAEAEVTFGGRRHVMDLQTGQAQRIEADGTRRTADIETREAAPKPDIQPWGPGPTIAGYPSVYHVIRVEDELCGELLISPWMKPFVDPAIDALAILERIRGEGDIRQTGLDGACGKLPFSSYAMAGWPLMAGGVDRPIFKTEAIEFDYQPTDGELDRAD